MRLARVEGSIWAIQKEKGMENIKLLIVQPINVEKQPEGNVIIAMDRIGAGIGEFVIITQGTPAQKLMGEKGTPIDAAIVGIVDSLEVPIDQ
ncbi:EutN/CcmL family microcompartment protein [Bacillus salipaludis]|uniref:EutN/CcmL family microcompartment protein n=1 Tax=Bacillus salipaludis TaxID=2547811 RepID=A0AA90QYI4_9BACI|nr:EutN/CcmL family microcompartment protein [Bacillus salipaludis]MDQ6598554.1 EutN/CcmL family microcompartment protein [Bacillus salipaludis]